MWPLIVFLWLAPAPKPITLTATPRVCMAPCTIHAKVIIEKHPANLTLRVRVDSLGFYRYSEIALHPNSPTLYLLPYKDLPEGYYTIDADLVRHDGRSWVAGRASDRVQVGP